MNNNSINPKPYVTFEARYLTSRDYMLMTIGGNAYINCPKYERTPLSEAINLISLPFPKSHDQELKMIDSKVEWLVEGTVKSDIKESRINVENDFRMRLKKDDAIKQILKQTKESIPPCPTLLELCIKNIIVLKTMFPKMSADLNKLPEDLKKYF
jgi:hypothetical protein